MDGQTDETAVLWLLAAAFTVTALILPVMMLWYINRVSPEAISRRLLAGCPAIRRRTKWLKPAWDPSQPRGVGMWTQAGPGIATYTLTPEGQVRLELVRHDGRREEHVGPPLSRSTAAAWGKVIWLPPITYLSGAFAGTVVGYLTGRSQGAAVGLMLGFVVAYLLLMLLGGAVRRRAIARRI